MNTKTCTILGDKLEIHWTGNVWEAPSTHRTFTSAKAAMREELEQYFLACGDDIEDESTLEEIEGILSNME